MWQQIYTPAGDSLGLSTLVAAVPLFVLLYLLGVRRTASWVAALSGLASALAVALAVYGMPAGMALSATLFGAAFGLWPISWVVFWAIFLYRLSVDSGQFEVVKDSIGSLTRDRRLQALLIAFAFGAFVEGAAGFGTPVAVAAAMLTGLGFSGFYASAICLLANTAPVAFGSVGTPLVTLAGITGLPLMSLSAGVGRICAPVSLIVPLYLIAVMGGWRAVKGVWPAIAVCGLTFAGAQLFVSNTLGPELTDILGSVSSIGGLILLMKLWQPKDSFDLPGASPQAASTRHYSAGQLLRAWSPYILLVICVLVWSQKPVKAALNQWTLPIHWPGLHLQVLQTPPVVAKDAAYAATFQWTAASAPGTACLLAGLLAWLALGASPQLLRRAFTTTVKQLAKPTVTVASVLGLAFLMNYSGMTGTLGLAFAATGVLFPYFSSMLGWLGVFLTGSDTSANALFGNLQVVTANKLGLNPVLMAASNSSGGVMGKMISLQSIAVAVAATGMKTQDESRLFRFTLGHSILLASMIGLVTVFYAYARPDLAP